MKRSYWHDRLTCDVWQITEYVADEAYMTYCRRIWYIQMSIIVVACTWCVVDVDALFELLLERTNLQREGKRYIWHRAGKNVFNCIDVWLCLISWLRCLFSFIARMWRCLCACRSPSLTLPAFVPCPCCIFFRKICFPSKLLLVIFLIPEKPCLLLCYRLQREEAAAVGYVFIRQMRWNVPSCASFCLLAANQESRMRLNGNVVYLVLQQVFALCVFLLLPVSVALSLSLFLRHSLSYFLSQT